jgi:type III pantothenate kinase
MGVDSFPLVAVDIGNSRIKLGLFGEPGGVGLPAPLDSLSISDWNDAPVESWLRQASERHLAPKLWRLCSVNRPLEAQLIRWLTARSDVRHERLIATELPLEVSVERPDLVGMDRLVNAIAANRLRQTDRAAIVIDVGSAITVDLVSSAGAFQGGAILPGIAMSARALHDYTDLLPLIPMSELGVPPVALGTATLSAMRSGLYWGAVGAMRELIARLSQGQHDPHVFLTGGAAPAVAQLLSGTGGDEAEFIPHLTLGGVALAGKPT